MNAYIMDRAAPINKAPKVLSNAGRGIPGTGTGPPGAAPGIDVMAGSVGGRIVGVEDIDTRRMHC